MISLHEGQGAAPGKKRRPPEQALHLELTVEGCAPRIWRTLVVKESLWLSRLHDIIQVAFDWFDYQTHTFTLGELRYGNPGTRDARLVEDDRDLTLADIELGRHGALTYDYHFGEGWRVAVRVVQSVPVTKGLVTPACLAGERAGPPEDCGGLEAYHDMLACIKEPTTEIGREWIEWLGPAYDSERCDLAAINASIKKLGK